MYLIHITEIKLPPYSSSNSDTPCSACAGAALMVCIDTTDAPVIPPVVCRRKTNSSNQALELATTHILQKMLSVRELEGA